MSGRWVFDKKRYPSFWNTKMLKIPQQVEYTRKKPQKECE